MLDNALIGIVILIVILCLIKRKNMYKYLLDSFIYYLSLLIMAIGFLYIIFITLWN